MKELTLAKLRSDVAVQKILADSVAKGRGGRKYANGFIHGLDLALASIEGFVKHYCDHADTDILLDGERCRECGLEVQA